jgi:hypothetical protein
MRTLYAFVNQEFFNIWAADEFEEERDVSMDRFLRTFGTPQIASDKEGDRSFVPLTGGLYVRINNLYESDFQKYRSQNSPKSPMVKAIERVRDWFHSVLRF